MKPLLTLLLALGTTLLSRADVKFVDFHKIDPQGRYAREAAFLVRNLPYYDHWSPDWTYDVSKDSIVRELKSCLSLFEPLRNDELETDLLLGEVAHYLYNLDQQAYFDTAERYLLDAIRIKPADLRGYWFLGYDYAQSNETAKAVDAFDSALVRAGQEAPSDFWQEYAFTMLTAGMPAHCRYALDKFILKGGDQALGLTMDSMLRRTMIWADPDSSYGARDLWEEVATDPQVVLLSRPLGMRAAVDSTWNVEPHEFQNGVSALVLRPGVVKSAKGTGIGYTIAVIAHVAQAGETLADFMKKFTQPGSVPDTTSALTKRYPNSIAYHLTDESVYTDRGGGRFFFMGIERDCPKYPGWTLEDIPQAMRGPVGKLNFFVPGLVRQRFRGKMFYLILVDTCGDIYDTSWKIFSGFVTKGLVIE